MLTPQEIQEMKFEKAVFGGYDMAQIDKFLDEIQVDYTLLYKENTALKGKMRVLSDKVDEYRAVDDQMREALYAAKSKANEIVSKANEEAAAILSNAQAEAKKRSENIETEIYANTLKLKEMRDASTKYAKTVTELMNNAVKYVSAIENKSIDEYIKKALSEIKISGIKDDFDIKLPDEVTAPEAPETETKTAEPTREIAVDDGEKEELLKLSLNSEKEEEEARQDEEEDEKPRPKFVFSELKFGKAFDDEE